ncbi:MAG: aspartate aminotransferase, partial [Cyanobium sp.]
MPISDRLAQLGSGVFARNDRRKSAYLNLACDPTSGLLPLLDLSLGSTDLQPPTVAIEAMAAQLARP